MNSLVEAQSMEAEKDLFLKKYDKFQKDLQAILRDKKSRINKEVFIEPQDLRTYGVTKPLNPIMSSSQCTNSLQNHNIKIDFNDTFKDEKISDNQIVIYKNHISGKNKPQITRTYDFNLDGNISMENLQNFKLNCKQY